MDSASAVIGPALIERYREVIVPAFFTSGRVDVSQRQSAVLVTGAAGGIGREIVRLLADGR